MSLNYGQGYSVYRSLRDKIRASKRSGYIYGRPPSDVTPGQGPVSDVVPDVPSDTAPPSPSYGGFAGEMSDLIGGTFASGPGGSMQISADQIENISSSAKQISSGEYAIDQATPYGIGVDIATATGSETAGAFAENLVGVMDSSPFGVISGLMAGKKTKDPYGKTTAIPGGVLGLVAEANIKQQYEVAEKIKAGTPGFHQMRGAGGLFSIVPQTVFGKQVGYAVLGTYEGTSQQAINQYASMYGYDPRSVDLMSRPENPDFGTQLEGYSTSLAKIGGFTEDGMYASPATAEVQDVSDFGLGAVRDHMGLMAQVYGLDTALNITSNLSGISDTEKTAISQGLQYGNITASPVVIDGDTVGYETMSGGVVKDKDGNPVTSIDQETGRKSPVTFGTGIISSEAVSKAVADNSSFDEGDTGDTGGQGGYGGRGGAENETGYGTPFAEGGQVPQSDRPTPQNAPVVAEAGFIEEEPENASPAETVADDKAIDVPEGTFIINAPAVEYMGSADVKKMILEAMDEAKKQGIDIQQKNAKLPKEDLVSLVVSKGEVIIPPQLAEIIGYDRLNKINNRGKQEVEKRIAENGQAPEAGPQGAAEGGTQVNQEDMYARNLLDILERHPTKEEPHVPTDNSGVTVGRGVDLSRHSSDDLKRMGVEDSTIKTLSPYLARGQGKYGATGNEARQLLKDFPLQEESVEKLDEAVYQKKKKQFDKAFPEFNDALPKDKAMAFSAFYVAGEKGMRNRYKTFLNTYNETGDIVKAMDKGFLQLITDKKSPERNRAFNALNWYFTSDDQALLNKKPSEQEQYTREMIEAFRRKEELQNAPAGFIPKPSTGKI